MDEGDPIHPCKHCGALFWYAERSKKDKKKRVNVEYSMCCQLGKVDIPLMRPPPEQLLSLFFSKKTTRSRNFLDNIRQYNNMFAFTSMGGKIIDVNSRGGGPYSYVLSGTNHQILVACYLHLVVRLYFLNYIYDTENEVANRIKAVR